MPIKLPRELAAGRAGGGIDDTIEDLVDELLDGDAWEPLIEPIVEPLRQLAEEAGSLEELRDRLAEVLAKAGTDELTAGLARALFAGRLTGETGAAISDNDSGRS